MVDCAGWGQYPKSIADAGQSVLQSDSQKNIMFSIHMYEYAGAYGAVQNNIDSSLAVGAPLCIGEFGIWSYRLQDYHELLSSQRCRLSRLVLERK